MSRHGAICRIAAPWRSRFGLEAIVSRSSEWAWVGGAVALVALRPTGGPTSGGPAIATDRAIIPGGGWHPAWSTWSPRPPSRSVSTADASSSHPARVGVSLSRSTARAGHRSGAAAAAPSPLFGTSLLADTSISPPRSAVVSAGLALASRTTFVARSRRHRPTRQVRLQSTQLTQFGVFARRAVA